MTALEDAYRRLIHAQDLHVAQLRELARIHESRATILVRILRDLAGILEWVLDRSDVPPGVRRAAETATLALAAAPLETPEDPPCPTPPS